MRRLALCLAVTVAVLVIAPAALADGPTFVVNGGAGVATRSGATHWVTVSDENRGTLLEKVEYGQEKPSGEPFVHALDTVRGVAHCIDLPENRGLYNIVLSLRDDDRTLAAQWRSGRPWLRVAVGSWRISYPGPASRGRGQGRESAVHSPSSRPVPYSPGAAAVRKSSSTRERSSGSRSVR